MRAPTLPEYPVRLGWLWVSCAELRRPPRARKAKAPPRLGLDLELHRPDWQPWVVGEAQINENRSIQAVLRDGPAAASWWRWLLEVTHPLPLVVGMGFGELRGVRRPDGSILVGGPALETARRALWSARQERRLAAVAGVGGAEAGALASLLEMMAAQRQGWTRRQAQTVRLARTRSGREVAREMGVGPSVVSESLSAAGFHTALRAEESLRGLLGCYGAPGCDLDGLRPSFPALTAPIAAESCA